MTIKFLESKENGKNLGHEKETVIEFDYDWEIYAVTQSPAFGCVDGLII